MTAWEVAIEVGMARVANDLAAEARSGDLDELRRLANLPICHLLQLLVEPDVATHVVEHFTPSMLSQAEMTKIEAVFLRRLIEAFVALHGSKGDDR